MTNRFMMSVAAAALIAGTGFASAQGTGPGRDAPSAGPATQQSAPSSDRAAPSAATPMNRDTSDKAAPAAKTTQSDDKTLPQGGKNLRAQDDLKAGAKGEKSAQDNNIKGEKSKSISSEMNDKSKAGKDIKAEGREDRMNAQGREERKTNMSAEEKGAVGSKTTGQSQPGTAQSQTGQSTQSQPGTMQSQTGQSTQSQTTTTGQVGAAAKLSTEQRTQITTVIRSQHVAPATNVNFSIAVGTRVPRTVSFHPLPREVVTIYPQWRGYEYFLVNNQIIVVNPRTLEIVDVIDV